eukprot:CAMPEP_0181311452 /NCGR_PEP_ID=MMETSP1101-20121128/13145_1 /TAXON_ID=46948 /ORGANISM="Rhodomonas abbreviata, Strain Caron Lab Isolate" /LENGTH=720 /DNA_ID=CAMNT_0023418185 /DNA_START=238 /DNA_END=2396 /DNA_ORIENTATION=+
MLSKKRVRFDAPTQENEESSADPPPPVDTSSMGIQHLSYGCPGLTGAGSRMLVEPRTFHQVFTNGHHIVIPLFQRAYCWGDAQIRLWWNDTIGQSSRGFGNHHTGKAVFKQEEGRLLCIDGQQRTSTMLLMLAAIRDAALLELRNNNPTAPLSAPNPPSQAKAAAQQLVDDIDAILFPDVGAMRSWASHWARAAVQAETAGEGSAEENWANTHKIGEQLPFSGGARVLPSFVDRAPFFELLTFGTCRHELAKAKWEEEEKEEGKAIALVASERARRSKQGNAKAIFDAEARRLGQRYSDATRRIEAFRAAVEHAMHSVQLVYCEVLNKVNLAQIFLWLQEKSLFGMGALLHNAHPGLAFRPSDLARNLLLSSSVMRQKSMEEQESIFRRQWIEPLEQPAGGPEALDELISRFITFLDHQTTGTGTGTGTGRHAGPGPAGGTDSGRYVGSLEQRLGAMTAMLPGPLAKSAGEGTPMRLYARLHSYAEWLHVQLLQRGRGKEEAERGSEVSEQACAGTAHSASGDVQEQWDSTHKTGVQLPFSGGARILPSYVDRAPFFELLTLGTIRHELAKATEEEEAEKEQVEEATALVSSERARLSKQGSAKAIFDAEARRLGQRCSDVVMRIALFRAAVENALHRVQLMYCEVLNQVNLAQIFLWLQEKHLFGEGAQLNNTHPGLAFRPSDLTRNLLLSSAVMRQKSMEEQEAILRRQWIEPLEQKA